MLFSSLVFIWFFLPIVFFLYHIIPGKSGKNLLLLAASLFFYAWGEPKYIILMLVSIVINYVFGLFLGMTEKNVLRSLLLAACAAVNLGLLGYYKYFDFFLELLNIFLGRAAFVPKNIALPIGISFYTFQALSYVIDVYRRDIRVQKNLFSLALYISFFPQLIAGPIVKYHDIEQQISERKITLEKQVLGIKRFSYGMGKKVILSNAFALAVDQILLIPWEEKGTVLMWFAALLYTFQIYYDFSGYSDMAIGLGKMFGFDFLENFNYPYLSDSVSEFWRRWHISLSTWFKEYLYIPLGGNRKGTARTCINLFIVFMVTGLWHGASITFVLWGVYYGILLVAERLFLGKWMKKNPWKWVNHLYTMGAVIFGWVLFRAESLTVFKRWMKRLLFWEKGRTPLMMYADTRLFVLLFLGILFCGPVQKRFSAWKKRLYREDGADLWDVLIMAVLMVYSTTLLVSNTYNPFIYFRF